MLADLMFVLDQFVLQGLLGICGSGRQTGPTSMTSPTRWKPSRSLSTHMSNDVVMVPFSLKPRE